jgi:hypothetical protein
MVPLVVAALVATFAPSAFADARAEAAAKAATKKAQADYKAMNYGRAATRLQKALTTCGTKKCSPATRASLLADLGVMQFKKGNKDDATKWWTDAAKAQPGVALNSAYASGDVQSAFDAATSSGAGGGGAAGGGGGGGAAGGGGGGGGGAQPSGDFAHTPPTEQTVDTPLPVYVQGGSDRVVRVVVKYKGAGGSAWKRIDLKKLDSSWGGFIPCADVTQGSLRYYIQGFDESKEPVANNGDSRHPYTVAIKSSIDGEAPHLPGKSAPESCEKSSDCPPDFPGCSKSGASAGENGEDSGEGEEGEGDESESKNKGGPYKRFWVGLGAEYEFTSLPSGSDLCYEDPNSALPVNKNNMYCTTQSGDDFPSRNSRAQNNSLCTAAQWAAGVCPGEAGGNSDGGITPANLRIMASFDYALTKNLLAGARIGVSLFTYPGSAAGSDGRAFGIERLYLEARGTWVFGDNPLGDSSIHPLALLGIGAAEFDAHTSSFVANCPAASTNPPAGQCSRPAAAGYQAPVTGHVNVWQINAPVFVTLGAGARWAVTPSIALTAALRFNGSFGVNGLVPTFGPEVGAAYGF